MTERQKVKGCRRRKSILSCRLLAKDIIPAGGFFWEAIARMEGKSACKPIGIVQIKVNSQKKREREKIRKKKRGEIGSRRMGYSSFRVGDMKRFTTNEIKS